MPQSCQSCNRGPQSGVSRSHAMNQTRRKFNINLQTRTIGGKKIQVCTKCIKTGKKNAAKAEANKKARA